MKTPKFTIDKIKYGVDRKTYERAIEIYKDEKIKDFKDDAFGYSAKVQGTHLYNVSVNTAHFDLGACNCYIGQQGDLCKHMVAVAIYALFRGKKIPTEIVEVLSQIRFSGVKGEMNSEELAVIKTQITEILKLIRPYNGPSRIWFAYQADLSEGVNRLIALLSDLPVSKQTSDLFVDVLIRLERKLTNGVDDSDGTVGEFMLNTVDLLKEFAKLDPECIKSFTKLIGIDTCFGWENDLVRIPNKGFE